MEQLIIQRVSGAVGGNIADGDIGGGVKRAIVGVIKNMMSK